MMNLVEKKCSLKHHLSYPSDLSFVYSLSWPIHPSPFDKKKTYLQVHVWTTQIIKQNNNNSIRIEKQNIHGTSKRERVL